MAFAIGSMGSFKPLICVLSRSLGLIRANSSISPCSYVCLARTQCVSRSDMLYYMGMTVGDTLGQLPKACAPVVE